jgi:transcriptional regulator with XRE-family HTH domain
MWKAWAVAGGVVRYARKAMGLRQTDLARHLGCAAETISRWGNGTETMPRQAQLLAPPAGNDRVDLP